MSHDAPSTCSTLLRDLRAPHADRAREQAWELFVARYQPVVFRWTGRFGVSESDREGACWEVFTKVLRVLPKYARDPKKRFAGWLYTVAKRACLDFRRKAANRRCPAPDGLSGVAAVPENSIEATDERRHRGELLRWALTEIEPTFQKRLVWDAFCLSMFEGKTDPEVAAQLGITERRARYYRRQVVDRLRAFLSQPLRGVASDLLN